jgi:hypothetical protein
MSNNFNTPNNIMTNEQIMFNCPNAPCNMETFNFPFSPAIPNTPNVIRTNFLSPRGIASPRNLINQFLSVIENNDHNGENQFVMVYEDYLDMNDDKQNIMIDDDYNTNYPLIDDYDYGYTNDEVEHINVDYQTMIDENYLDNDGHFSDDEEW